MEVVAPDTEETSVPGEGATLLFVDDDERVANLIRRNFESTSYICLYAPSAIAAKDLLEREHVDVVVSDIKMPEMDGTELLAYAAKEHPEIIRIAMSGTFDISDTIAAINQGHVSNYVLKPFNSARLKIMIYRELKNREDARKARERELARQRNAANRARESGRSLKELKTFMNDMHNGLVDSILVNFHLSEPQQQRYQFTRSLIARIARYLKRNEKERLQLELAALFFLLPNKVVVDVYNRHTSSDYIRRGILIAKKEKPEILLLAQRLADMVLDEEVPWPMAVHRITREATAQEHVNSELLLAINEIDGFGPK